MHFEQHLPASSPLTTCSGPSVMKQPGHTGSCGGTDGNDGNEDSGQRWQAAAVAVAVVLDWRGGWGGVGERAGSSVLHCGHAAVCASLCIEGGGGGGGGPRGR